MRLICIAASILLIFAGCASKSAEELAAEQAARIKKIAVMPFMCAKPHMADKIAARLSKRLGKSTYEVISNDDLKALLKENNITRQDCFVPTPQTVEKLSKSLDGIVVGSATIRLHGGYVEHIAKCSATLINTRTTEQVMTVDLVYERTGNTWKGAVTPNKVAKDIAKSFKSQQ